LYLKNITLRGFKSFGNKSSLDFEHGISVIVGPNGSGKSNVADAISWVLGEQSPKSLRGSSMGDVIFRSKNQEMGIAEVSLLFDNKDRIFDVDFREVKITRRVFSRGGSDYFINSSPCRLMDIQEMTGDSGIGKGLHIIINQGQVNEIAILKPVERKLVIDEMIGLSKHKSRRKKSIDKIDKVKSDIGRLDDLMSEIKRTMDPLEIESKRAREYADMANELKKEEISLFLSDLKIYNNLWDEMEGRSKKLRDSIRETDDRILKIEKEKNDLFNNISSEQSKYENLRARIESFESSLGMLSNTAALVKSKKNVFSTLYSMFEMELGNGVLPNNTIKNSIPGKKGGAYVDLSFLKKVIDRLEKLENKMRSFLESIGGQLKGKHDAETVIGEGNRIIESLGKIIGDIKAVDSIQESKKSRVNIEEKKAVPDPGLNNKIKKIQEIKEVCKINLERADRMSAVLESFKKGSEIIKESLYPEFEKYKELISDDRGRIDRYDRKISDLKLDVNKFENEIYKIDLRKEQLREKVKSVTSAMVDDYNVSIDYASKNFKPSGNPRDSEVRVKNLKSRMKNFGNVNPNAAIEFSKIKKRYDFLDEQRKDLVEARDQLKGLIKEIDEKISSIFLEKFEKINESFQKYFKLLFPHGEGEMIPESYESDEPDDENMGVDLKVDIGNNKLVSLSLLSGGEKSLVSLAFQFSVFSINTAPFYIFDEVDAALDDANIERFLNLVKKFSEKQQIIIITHQKKTMEIADKIYGVTMQSDGISKVVSEKIDKKDTAGIINV
jgi:chromosome segregation ATPase